MESDTPVTVDTATYDETPIDWSRLLKATGNDEELANELAVLFIDSGANTMQQILAALESRDFDQLGAKAHEIKGASANLQALAASALAAQLESAARGGDVAQVPDLTRALKLEIDRAVEYLRSRVA
jgi:HPt (histidine-containing phosphotransfer) domain-containing protein